VLVLPSVPNRLHCFCSRCVLQNNILAYDSERSLSPSTLEHELTLMYCSVSEYVTPFAFVSYPTLDESVCSFIRIHWANVEAALRKQSLCIARTTWNTQIHFVGRMQTFCIFKLVVYIVTTAFVHSRKRRWRGNAVSYETVMYGYWSSVTWPVSDCTVSYRLVLSSERELYRKNNKAIFIKKG
jgi:hypothetical protein